jgi:hypothetical protein
VKKTDSSEIKERCDRFWKRENTDRPLVGALFNRMAPATRLEQNLQKRSVKPADITEEVFIDDCNRRHNASEQIEGDAIFVAAPYIGLPWLDAIMGCEVECGGGSAWAKPLESDWKEYTIDSVPWDNGWFDTMQEETKIALDISKGRFPVGPVHLRGMGDLIATLMGQTEFCLSLYDYPDIIRRIIDIYVDVWRKIVQAQYSLLKPDEGGFWNANQPLWTPAETMFIPADVASLVSPEMFKEFFFEPTRTMLKGYDYCIMHTHSSYLDAYPLDLLMTIPELKAVQIGIDPNGPSVEDLIPQFRHVMEQRSLIVAGGGVLSAEDIRLIIKKLPPEGLCILSYKETVEECREVINQAWK